MRKILIGLVALIVASSLAWAANNYRVNTASGTITTLKTTDTAGVHVPHVNVDSGTVTATLPTGTAGTANAEVLSVQGIASMTPLLVTLGAETTKVIGTVNQGTSPWVVSATLAAETTKVIGTVNQGTSPWVVSGPLTDTQLRATAVPVSGTFWQATQPVSIAAAPLIAIGITPTDRTVTSATGASQTVMAANASRHSVTIVNTGSANCGVNPTGGTAAIGGAGTLTLVPNGSYSPRVPTLSAVTAICTAGQPLYAEEN